MIALINKDKELNSFSSQINSLVLKATALQKDGDDTKANALFDHAKAAFRKFNLHLQKKFPDSEIQSTPDLVQLACGEHSYILSEDLNLDHLTVVQSPKTFKTLQLRWIQIMNTYNSNSNTPQRSSCALPSLRSALMDYYFTRPKQQQMPLILQENSLTM